MSTTKRFKLNYLYQHQVAKDIIVNNNIDKLDKLLWMSVEDVNIKDQPDSPVDGNAYLIGSEPNDPLVGKDHHVALYREAYGWDYIPPIEGVVLYVKSQKKHFIFQDSFWQEYDFGNSGDGGDGEIGTELANMDKIGIKMEATDQDRLFVKSSGVFFVHEDHLSDIKFKISKKTESSTASMGFYDNYSIKAEMGLIGSDEWSIKVTPNGSDFYESMSIQSDSGQVLIKNGCHLANGLQFEGSSHRLADYAEGSWTPALGGDSVAGSVDYKYQTGNFIKIGKLVFLHFLIAINDTLKNASGSIIVTGLPYDPAHSNNFVGNATMHSVGNVGVGNVPLNIAIVTAEPKIFLYGVSGIGVFNLVSSHIKENFEIRGSITYITL